MFDQVQQCAIKKSYLVASKISSVGHLHKKLLYFLLNLVILLRALNIANFVVHFAVLRIMRKFQKNHIFSISKFIPVHQ